MRASLPAPEKTSTPVKDNPPPEQDSSTPDVHMDTGAQQDDPDIGADTSSTETADNACASSKSAGIDKGKGLEVPEVRAEPEQAASGQATPTTPEKLAPQTSALEKTAPAPAKTSIPTTTPALAPAKAAPTPPAQAKPTTFKIPEIPAKPRAIDSKLFSIQQRLYLVADATTVSF
jgi:hypothetical protein